MKNRNHFYLYTVEIRGSHKTTDEKGREYIETTWTSTEVANCANMHDVAGKLQKNINDIRYKHKEIEK